MRARRPRIVDIVRHARCGHRTSRDPVASRPRRVAAWRQPSDFRECGSTLARASLTCCAVPCSVTNGPVDATTVATCTSLTTPPVRLQRRGRIGVRLRGEERAREHRWCGGGHRGTRHDGRMSPFSHGGLYRTFLGSPPLPTDEGPVMRLLNRCDRVFTIVPAN